MRSLFYLILAHCCLCGAFFSDAARALDPARSIFQYRHTRWTAAEGAPPVIYALAQGADGYLWIGSAAGLHRFDGVVFEYIQSNVPDGATGRVISLLAARDGTIWAGYNSGDIAMFRSGVLRKDRSAPKIDAVNFSIHQATDGTIWVIPEKFTTHVWRLRSGRWEKVQTNFGWQPASGQALATRDGAFWLLAGKTAYTWLESTGEFIPVPGTVSLTPDLTAISEDTAGHIWVSGDFGTRPISVSATKVFATPPFRTWIVFTRFDRDGNLWGLNREGLFRLRAPTALPSDGEADEVERFRAADGLSANTAAGFLEDREGNIWIGSSLGLDQFRNADVVVEKKLTGLPYLGFGLLGASDGTVYVGTSDGLYRIPQGASPRLLSSTARNAHQICEATDGQIWAFSEAGSYLVKDGETRRPRFADLPATRMPAQGLGGCALDRRGVLWVNGVDAGLFSSTTGGWAHHSRARSQEPIVSLTRDSSARPVALYKSGTIAQLDDGDRPGHVLFQPATVRPLPLGSFIAHGRRDLFLVDSAGLGRVRGGKWQGINTDRFPWFADPRGVVETPGGQVWMIGRAGIVGLASTELDALFGDGGARPHPVVLSFDDGLPNVGRTLGQNGAVRGGDGRLWFVTIGGVVSVDPSRLTQNMLAPPVHVRGLRAGKRHFRDPVNMSLDAGTSSIAIQYTALSLSIPQRVRFKYRLEGVDDDWVDAGPRREAFYTNLGAGHYRFRVIAANDHGVWNRQGAAFDFDIAPTFLQSGLFRIIALMSAGLLAWGLYEARLRQLTAKMRAKLEDRLAERERIARDLHDTLLQGFQGLILRFQAGANEIPEGLYARTLIERTLDSADEVLKAGRNSVSQLRTTETIDLTVAFAEAVESLRRDHPIPFDMVIEGTSRELHPVVREELYRIGNEALINAFRHSRATLIELAISYQDLALVLGVRDNGTGIDDEIVERGQRQGHFGLVGMRERAGQIEAELVISSRAGHGTEVLITVPGRIAYPAFRRDAGWFRRIVHGLGIGS